MKKLLLCLALSALPAYGQAQVVVDHTSVDLFDQIPQEYLEAARDFRMAFVNRSVGQNIDDGLDCLAVQESGAPNHCTRWGTNPPEHWTGTYPRPNWSYYAWPGSAAQAPTLGIVDLDCADVYQGNWQTQGACFDYWFRQNQSNLDVAGYQSSYLELMAGSTLDDQFFAPQPNAWDVFDYVNLELLFPAKRFVWMTSSLARVIGTPDSQSFNAQMRTFVNANGGVLLDVADIESHRQDGTPCTTSSGIPNICADYTTETNGGHLGSVSQGKIRLAKAWWVLMAQLAGWEPNGPPPTPPPPPGDITPPVVDISCVPTDTRTDCATTYGDDQGLASVHIEMRVTATDTSGNVTETTAEVSGP